jgi:hypothetical protein
MKKLSIFIILLALLTSVACKKDDDTNNDDNNDNTYQPKGYIPLKVGSYWIYQHYMVLDNGTDSALSTIDSTYISGTIEINSKTYYISGKNDKPLFDIYVRDSVGYLVDTLGNIFMSETNFTDTIYSLSYKLPNGTILYHISTMMYNNHDNITVPAGNFADCLEGRNRVKLYSASAADPKLYYDHSYYAKNVGLLETSYRYTLSSRKYKKKLIRYYIP